MARTAICAVSFCLLLSSAALADPSESSPASAWVNPRASELFDRDSDLRQWAVRMFDSNHDGWLTLFEAQPALTAFKDIADGDRDGQVTPHEYVRAKEFIIARW